MARRVSRAETESLLARLRKNIPGLVMRTTLIAGFPGETERQFSELTEFVRDQRFERLGVFTYSYEASTPSAGLPDHLSEETKESRREELMKIQQEIAFSWNQRQVGQEITVLVDRPVPDQPDVWIARTYADAPDVDSVVWLSGPGVQEGHFVKSEVVAVSGYDLVAAKKV